MSAVFIAGTDTGIGKTVITGLLAKYLADKGYKVVTQKWIQTGSDSFPEDLKTHFDFIGNSKKDVEDYFSCMCSYNFSFPASPHLSAKLESKRIRIEKIISDFKFLADKFDFVIVEGTGGILVPINYKKLLIDIVKMLDLPVILVSGNKLGSINHTLLTLEVLKERGIKTLGLIFNNFKEKSDKKILKDNIEIIKRISGKEVMGVLPFSKEKAEMYKHFEVIGKKIEKKIKNKGSA